MSKYAPAVRGIQSEGAIRGLLLDAAIDGLKRQAGYIPDVMSLDNVPEPVDMASHLSPFDPAFDTERYLWLRWHYPSMFRHRKDNFWSFRLTWAENQPYQDKTLPQANTSQRVQTQHIDIG